MPPKDPRFDPTATPQLDREAIARELIDGALPDRIVEPLTPEQAEALRRRVEELEKHPDLAVPPESPLDEEP